MAPVPSAIPCSSQLALELSSSLLPADTFSRVHANIENSERSLERSPDTSQSIDGSFWKPVCFHTKYQQEYHTIPDSLRSIYEYTKRTSSFLYDALQFLLDISSSGEIFDHVFSDDQKRYPKRPQTTKFPGTRTTDTSSQTKKKSGYHKTTPLDRTPDKTQSPHLYASKAERDSDQDLAPVDQNSHMGDSNVLKDVTPADSNSEPPGQLSLLDPKSSTFRIFIAGVVAVFAGILTCCICLFYRKKILKKRSKYPNYQNNNYSGFAQPNNQTSSSQPQMKYQGGQWQSQGQGHNQQKQDSSMNICICFCSDDGDD